MNSSNKIVVSKISNYYLTSVLGEGSFGKVFKAINIISKKQYAAKSIKLMPIINNPRKLELLKNELKIMKKLRHPNIIKLKRVIRTNEHLYFILELCDGENLDSFLKNYQRLFNCLPPVHLIQHFMKQIVSAICYMHQNNMIHRDLKLENIMLSFSDEENLNDVFNPNTDEIFTKSSIFTLGEEAFLKGNYFYYNYSNNKQKFDEVMLKAKIKVIDLGFSRILDENGIASTFCGSPVTMAPEVWTIKLGNNNRQISYNNKIDMWSIGAITYHLLTGTAPFISHDMFEIFKKIECGFYSLPNKLELSLELIDFINGLLQFDPENRFSWNNVISHPFISKKYDDLIKLNLIKIDNIKYTNVKQLELDVFNRRNFLWDNYKLLNESIEIDQILEKGNLFIQEENKDYVINSSTISSNDDSIDSIFDDIITISIVEEDIIFEKEVEGFLILSINQKNLKN